jgi:hypothetical protein
MTKSRPARLLAAVGLALPVLAVASDALAQDADAPAPSGAPAPEAPAPTDAPAPAEEAKSSDLGLEWVWLNASMGFSYMDLKSANLAISPAGGTPITVVDSTSSGLAYDVGAGVRLLFLTLGVRARNHTAMNLWQIDGEVGFHGRIGRVDPYLAARFGYDTVGTLGQSVSVVGTSVAPPDISVHGYNGGLALGFDYYFAHAFSLGLEGAGDVVYLKRAATSPPALSVAEQTAINSNPQAKANYQQVVAAYQEAASSVGFGFGVFLHAGVHF